jgi:hypothetical protein
MPSFALLWPALLCLDVGKPFHPALIKEYNETRPHQGRWCFGKTPMQTFLDAMPMTKEKMIAA